MRPFDRPLLRGVLFLAPALLTFAAPVTAATTPASVIIGGKPVPFIVSPYVGADGQVYAPVDAVRLLGASYAPSPDGTTVAINGNEGRHITVPDEKIEGRYCVPLQKVALALGASADWQPTTRTLTIRARLEMVRQTGDALTVYTSYPVYYTVKTLDGPNRLYVDLYGLDLATSPAAVPVLRGGDVTQIRSKQFDYNTVRIVIDLRKNLKFQVASPIQTDQVRVALGDAAEAVAAQRPDLPPLPATPPARVVINPPPPVLPPATSGTVQITGLSYKVVSDALTQIVINTSGPAKYRTETLNNPNRLAFDLAGASLDPSVQTVVTTDNPVIKAIRAGILRTKETAFGRVVLDLSRLVGFTVTSQPLPAGGMTYLINLQTPHRPALAGANSLVDKVIVIDPGHGGKDTGATDGTGRVYEKDVNLAIGRKVRDVLVQNGATVLMTRDDDSFPALMSRPKFANDHHADYYISIHSDSSPRGQNTLAGTTVYFHMQNPVCRRLATDIVNRVAEVSGIAANGVKSDSIRFPSGGFGVLRGSQMPAVLVECGYMNNDLDLRKLRDSSTQQHIAEGVVAGLRDFIADRSAP